MSRKKKRQPPRNPNKKRPKEPLAQKMRNSVFFKTIDGLIKIPWKKKLGFSLLIFLLSGVFLLFGSHRFIPNSEVQLNAFYIAFVITLLAYYLFYHFGFLRKLINAARGVLNRLKLLLCLFVIFWIVLGVFFCFFGVAIPQMWTSVKGVRTTDYATLIKTDAYSKGECTRRLEFASYSSSSAAFFYLCVSRHDYEWIPTGDLKAILVLKRSSLGDLVEGVLIDGRLYE